VWFLGALLYFAAEVGVFVVIGQHTGFLWALVMLIGISALGPFIVRRVGIGVLADTQEKLARREVPARELLDGVVVLVGGVMICVPGFISDVLGLLVMIRPVRRLLIWVGGHAVARRVTLFRSSRWRVIDVRSRLTSNDAPGPPGPPEWMLEARSPHR
jgi:UPF0716 family protein affecting phage T7 exclusion